MDNTTLGAPWRKSTYSNGQGNCVEVASGTRNVMIRDTKQHRIETGRTVLSVPADAWRTFAESLR